MAAYWVYILTNRPRSTLYVGVTNDLVRRAYGHREGPVRGFSERYQLKMLVHFERFDTPQAAIQREKNLKHWPRPWKLQLVAQADPQWRDLHGEIARRRVPYRCHCRLGVHAMRRSGDPRRHARPQSAAAHHGCPGRARA